MTQTISTVKLKLTYLLVHLDELRSLGHNVEKSVVLAKRIKELLFERPEEFVKISEFIDKCYAGIQDKNITLPWYVGFGCDKDHVQQIHMELMSQDTVSELIVPDNWLENYRAINLR